MIKRKIIRTNNKEIYDKLSMLHFSKEVILQNIKPRQIKDILKNINKDKKILDIEQLGNYYIIKKINPFNVNIYLNNKKKY